MPSVILRRLIPWVMVLLLCWLVPRLLTAPLAKARDEETIRQARLLRLANRPDEALLRYREILRRPASQGTTSQRVAALVGSAQVLCVTAGDLDEASSRFHRALDLARRQGAPDLEADALSALGQFYWYYRRQRHRPLDEFYRPALELYTRSGDDRGKAVVHNRIALVHLAAGDYRAVAEHLETSRRLFTELGDAVGLSDVHRYLAVLQGQLERYDLARQHLEQSRRFSAEGGYVLGAERVAAQRAHLHLRLGEPQLSLEILDRLIASPATAAYSRRNHLSTRGNALLHLRRPQDARRSYDQALAIDDAAAGSDAPFRATTLAMLAHAHMQNADLEAAAAALARAEAIPIDQKGWGPTVTHSLARADLAGLTGDRSAALRHLLMAAEIEHQTFGSARSMFFQTQYQQIFDRLFALLLAGAVEQDAAEELTFRFLEQMRYRSFRSLMVRLGAPRTGERRPTPEETAALRQIEAVQRRAAMEPQDDEPWRDLRLAYGNYEDSVLRAELTASTYRLVAAERPVELSSLRQALAPGQALVEYVFAQERLFALTVTRDSLTSAVLPISTAALQAKVKLWRRQLFASADASGDAPADASSWRPLADELGRVLVQPLIDSAGLEGIEDLVLVPMGVLHDVPFAALGLADGRLMVEAFFLQRAPSATLWARGHRRRSRELSEPKRIPSVLRSGGGLAFGLRQSMAGGLPPLGAVEQEAAEVAKILGGRAKLGRQASEAAFKAGAAGSPYLHLATHGVAVPQVPLHSYLVLQAGDGEDGRLSVREILDLGLQAELVTLSACGTGLSPVVLRSAQLEVDRLGFVEAFLHAGAARVLATLMPVGDAASAELMQRFYLHLQTMDGPQALAAARREMVRRPASHWAPYIMVSGG